MRAIEARSKYPLAESHVYVAIVRGPDPVETLDNATVEWETEGGDPHAFPPTKKRGRDDR